MSNGRNRKPRRRCQKRGTKPDQRARVSLAPVRHELLHQAGDGGIGAVLGEVPHRELERERHPRRGARPISSRREESNSSAFQRVRGPRGPSSLLARPRWPIPARTQSPQVRLKDYIAKKEAGTLRMDKFNKRMATALQPVRARSRTPRTTFSSICGTTRDPTSPSPDPDQTPPPPPIRDRSSSPRTRTMSTSTSATSCSSRTSRPARSSP